MTSCHRCRRRRAGTGARARRAIVGSPASIGCVVDSVSARSSRAATIGSTVICRAVRLEHADERVAVGHRPPRHLVEAGADARHEPPDVDDALLDDHDRGREARLRTAGPRGWPAAPASSGSGSSAASIDGGDHLVLVGEGPEDRCPRRSRPPPRSAGWSPGRRARGGAAAWRRRSSTAARRAAAPSPASSWSASSGALTASSVT